MDGGRDQEPIPQQPPRERAAASPAVPHDASNASSNAASDANSDGPAGGSSRRNGRDEDAARAAARAAREAADVDAVACDPYLAEALARLHEAITDLADTRWSARGPRVLAAGLRALAREQARLDAATLRLVGDVDGRDDVMPRAKPKTAGAGFLRAALGVDRRRASRDADLARLITDRGGRGDQHPDLARVGAAYAAGDITRGHVEVAASVHRRLGATARERLMPDADPDPDPDADVDVDPDTGEVTGELTERRTIDAVDAILAARARDFTVPEFTRIGDRIVETLNPPGPDGAHARRYLHLSALADGSLSGKFFCGPAQALTLTAVIAALATPQPGRAIDADGAEIDLPDDRTAPQRRIDALLDAIDHHPCAHHLTPRSENTTGTSGTGGNENTAGTGGAQKSTDNDWGTGAADKTVDGRENAPDDTHDTRTAPADHHTDGGDLAQYPPGDRTQADDDSGDLAQSPEPPPESPPEGDWQVRRPPGVRTGPYPNIEIIVTATLDQLASARALTGQSAGQSAAGPPGTPSLDGSGGVTGAGHGGFAHARHGGRVHPATLALLASTAGSGASCSTSTAPCCTWAAPTASPPPPRRPP
jgi:hypothetical protein